MATIVREFRYESWARNLIGCACNAALGVICAGHSTYVAPEHPTKPRREDFATYGEFARARSEWKAPCDELAVCPIAAVVPCEPEPQEEAVTHFDIRLVCPVTRELEATEDIGHPTREAAERSLEYLGDRYQIVECSERGSHEVHDVDLSYYRHQRGHLGKADWPFERVSGAPTDDLIRHI